MLDGVVALSLESRVLGRDELESGRLEGVRARLRSSSSRALFCKSFLVPGKTPKGLSANHGQLPCQKSKRYDVTYPMPLPWVSLVCHSICALLLCVSLTCVHSPSSISTHAWGVCLSLTFLVEFELGCLLLLSQNNRCSLQAWCCCYVSGIFHRSGTFLSLGAAAAHATRHGSREFGRWTCTVSRSLAAELFLDRIHAVVHRNTVRSSS